MLKQVPAYEVYEVYADYDGYAPDTAGVAVVPTEEHAAAVCAALNEDPRAWRAAVVDGCEHVKAWRSRPGLVRTVTNDLLTMSCATTEEVVDAVLRDLREQQGD